MGFQGYGIYSSHHQGYWSSQQEKWVPWQQEATSLPTQAAADRFIENLGLVNTTDAYVRNGAYVCQLLG